MKEISDNTFNKEITENNVPVVVDFWAPWCGPCKMITPVMEELDKQYSGKAKFVKVNVDENPTTSQQFRISSIPTIMVFKDGKPVENMVGFRPKSDIEQILNRHI
ncbi:thioredoxin [Clostridium magnum]|uniref:Thioredoxin n=1 Tax=Clostridium magnum DSM 2767 TaxID=1121326 RepID=A0A162THP6_9CLOT|nr:thioredoxin [Clostridium magnum]KZL92657.1 thioredoxin-1 [Clostridium magnum DSM 2767]SHI24244.1 thioredoxin [Clostridium magnum DSM 2767]